jgi:hypothetical protein
VDEDQDENDVSRIKKPTDEFEYWLKLATSSSVTDLE